MWIDNFGTSHGLTCVEPEDLLAYPEAATTIPAAAQAAISDGIPISDMPNVNGASAIKRDTAAAQTTVVRTPAVPAPRLLRS